MSTADEAEGISDSRSLHERQLAGRNMVLRAAAEAFTTRGYAATSIDDIADRLNATKGRVYHYFRTKGEIFVGIHRRAIEIVLEAARPIFESDESATVRQFHMARVHALSMMTQSSFMRTAVQHTEMSLASEGRTRQREIDEVFELRNSYEAMFEDVIAEGIANGEFSIRDHKVGAKAVLGALNWMSVWYSGTLASGQHRQAEIADVIATFVVGGLGASHDAIALARECSAFGEPS